MAKKPYRSLTFKLMSMLLCSAVMAVALFFMCRWVGFQFVDRVILSPSRVESRIAADISSFRSFVEENNITSTNALAVGQWNQDHPDVYLTITGRDILLNSHRNGTELLLSDSGLALQFSDAMGLEFPVNFADGVCAVTIYNHAEERYYTLATILAVVISAVAFLISMLFYERHVTFSILRLNRQVRQVSRGDLQLQIQAPTRDEIGSLAEDVEAMRLSIIDQLRREEDAWQANTQLITAISHDVRTPLTALMGYLDILSDPGLPSDVQQAYLDICHSNALRLKDLTDELFGFFLVFGQRTPEQTLESFDAATLMEQILLEAQQSLQQQGFEVRLNPPEDLSGKLQIDLGHLRRVYENLFSNLRKYADPARPITVTGTVADHLLTVSIHNFIPDAVSRVESNKIGLKTCEKLLSAMGGSFRQAHTDHTFTAEVTLPLKTAE